MYTTLYSRDAELDEIRPIRNNICKLLEIQTPVPKKVITLSLYHHDFLLPFITLIYYLPFYHSDG